MKILAFDQSTKITGWALYDDGVLSNYGKIDLHTIHDSQERSIVMGKEIIRLVKNARPDLIVAEEVSLQNPNVKTVVELSRVQGLILSAAILCGLPFPVFYSPSEWRKEVGIQTGRGVKRQELKNAAIKLVAQTQSIQVSDDIADAILIGQCAVAKATE